LPIQKASTPMLMKGLQLVSAHVSFLPKVIFMNISFFLLILAQTVVLSVVTFFLIELRFRPNLYNFKDSLVLMPLKQRISDVLRNWQQRAAGEIK
jgi:hypothetical protein